MIVKVVQNQKEIRYITSQRLCGLSCTGLIFALWEAGSKVISCFPGCGLNSPSCDQKDQRCPRWELISATDEHRGEHHSVRGILSPLLTKSLKWCHFTSLECTGLRKMPAVLAAITIEQGHLCYFLNFTLKTILLQKSENVSKISRYSM